LEDYILNSLDMTTVKFRPTKKKQGRGANAAPLPIRFNALEFRR
jgi:hypothetical protein